MNVPLTNAQTNAVHRNRLAEHVVAERTGNAQLGIDAAKGDFLKTTQLFNQTCKHGFSFTKRVVGSRHE